MDNVFGVGGPELLLVLVLAVVFLGPLRMLKAARTLGKLVRDLRNYSKELMGGLRQELASLDEAAAAAPPRVPPHCPPRVPPPVPLHVPPRAESDAPTGPSEGG